MTNDEQNEDDPDSSPEDGVDDNDCKRDEIR